MQKIAKVLSSLCSSTVLFLQASAKNFENFDPKKADHSRGPRWSGHRGQYSKDRGGDRRLHCSERTQVCRAIVTNIILLMVMSQSLKVGKLAFALKESLIAQNGNACMYRIYKCTRHYVWSSISYKVANASNCLWGPWNRSSEKKMVIQVVIRENLTVIRFHYDINLDKLSKSQFLNVWLHFHQIPTIFNSLEPAPFWWFFLLYIFVHLCIYSTL